MGVLKNSKPHPLQQRFHAVAKEEKENEELKNTLTMKTPLSNTSTGYIKWGHYEDIKKILSDDDFSTTYITGLAGNGKTSIVHEICKELNRQCIRINIISTTDEEDLIGGYELVSGDTVWKNRSVVEAMNQGAVLLLDEVDLATERIMCLQPILEGVGVFVKKQNQWVFPNKGFSIVATANTKGRGSEDGKFVYTNIMNEAFLDRFHFTFEQGYPPPDVEEQILYSHITSNNITLTDDLRQFVKNLCRWAQDTRTIYFNGGGIGDVISTRRLIAIIKAYKFFHDKVKALNMGLSRYDETTKEGFISYYSKIDDIGVKK